METMGVPRSRQESEGEGSRWREVMWLLQGGPKGCRRCRLPWATACKWGNHAPFQSNIYFILCIVTEHLRCARHVLSGGIQW